MPYIPGFDVENEIAENRVIAKIVRRIFSTPSSLECKIIPESRYNPIFLEYKQGCYILKPKIAPSQIAQRESFTTSKNFSTLNIQVSWGRTILRFQAKTRITL